MRCCRRNLIGNLAAAWRPEVRPMTLPDGRSRGGRAECLSCLDFRRQFEVYGQVDEMKCSVGDRAEFLEVKGHPSMPTARLKLGMGHLKNPEFTEADSILDEEDEATLAAIDEGIKAADEGRVVSEEEVRKLIPQWISKFSTQTPR